MRKKKYRKPDFLRMRHTRRCEQSTGMSQKDTRPAGRNSPSSVQFCAVPFEARLELDWRGWHISQQHEPCQQEILGQMYNKCNKNDTKSGQHFTLPVRLSLI